MINQQQIFEIFESHPILGTILILAFMFFMTVLWKDWPENLFGITFGTAVDDDDDEEEEKKYSVNWEQTNIRLGDHGLPEAVEGTLTIKEED